MTKRTHLLQAALATILLALAILFFPHGTILPPVHASNVTIHLVAHYISGWNGTNPTITVLLGDSVTIVWSNGDSGVPHQFLLDIDRDGLDTTDCSPSADPCTTGASTTGGTVSFTASTAGSYKYYCTVHPTSMVGNFIVQSPGFSMTSTPSSLTIIQGSSTISTITLGSERGFSGTINLTPTIPPGGPTVGVSPTSVTVSPGSPATSTLTVSTTPSTPTGSYTVTVNGASSSTTNMTTVTVTVTAPNFSISSSPASLTVIQGSTPNITTIRLTSLNGFSGTISLTATVPQTGLTVSFNPTSVTVSSGGSGTSTMTVSTSSTPPGVYTAKINGTSGSTVNTTTINITVTIPDFTISPSLSILSLAQGSTTTATITLSSLSGFKGTLTLRGAISPSGPTVTFSPASVMLASGGTVTSIITASAMGGAGSPVSTGTYTLTVTVTNGTLTHTTTVMVTVGNSSASNLPLTVLAGVSVVLIAAAGITVYLVRRKTGRKQPS